MEVYSKRFKEMFLLYLIREDCEIREDFDKSCTYIFENVLSKNEVNFLMEWIKIYTESKSMNEIISTFGMCSCFDVLEERRKIFHKIRLKEKYYKEFFTEGYESTISKINKEKRNESNVPIQSNVFKTSLSDIGLSKRTLDCLNLAGYTYTEDFIGKSLEDISNIKGIGKVRRVEILEKLSVFGFSFN